MLDVADGGADALDPLAVVRRRLITQGLAGMPFADATDAVRCLGAVQAQEFAEAKWSLADRTIGCTDAAVQAACDRGDIIRTHLLRPTWHFVAREDVRWLLRLTRPRVHALNAYWYRRCELDAALLTRAHDSWARRLADGEPRTRAELVRELAGAGIAADGLRLAYLLMHAELEELMCSGPLRGKQQTYALLDQRAPTAALDERSADAALDDLVLRYFSSRGPATVKDFTSWSGMTAATTRAALQRVGHDLERTDDATGRAWYSSRDPGAGSADRQARAFLLPMYDEMIVSYQDLRVVTADEQPWPSLLERAIVIDGRTVGSWKRALTARSVAVTATLFDTLTADQSEALTIAVGRFGEFLELTPSLLTAPAA